MAANFSPSAGTRKEAAGTSYQRTLGKPGGLTDNRDGVAIEFGRKGMSGTLRIDKWLWFARFFKTRSLAAAVVAEGEVLLNGVVVGKTSALVRAGDELVFPTGKRRRRVTVLELGDRRGPAPEAQALYREEEPPPPEDPFAPC